MKVEFVGLGDTHGYVHDESTNLKKLAKQITDETGVATDIRTTAGKGGDELIVAGNIVPVGGAVVVKNGSASTLSSDAFKAQYREIVDFDTTAVDKSITKIEKRMDALEAFKDATEAKAVANAKTPKAAGKAKADPVVGDELAESEPAPEPSAEDETTKDDSKK